MPCHERPRIDASISTQEPVPGLSFSAMAVNTLGRNLSSDDDRPLSPVRSHWPRFAAFAIWGSVLYGALSLRDIETPFDYAMCGPWGCFPPLSAVAACHAGWLIVLTPALFWAHHHLLHSVSWKIAGAVLTAIGAVSAAIVAVRALWLDRGSIDQTYPVQKLALNVFTTTDFPIVPLLVLGVVTLAAGLFPSVARAIRRQPKTIARAGLAASDGR
ncbi:MAG: hypothetical protein DWQ37_06455 [Planctomycetota bacterium]|nr:MAG: hypothetical protein DWQ37_06455 [Planctomycetota bacterium]